jgi:5'-nucleotidase / UDP-sugar diphosphatase
VCAIYIPRYVPSSPCQNTRVLSANLVPASTSALVPLKQQGYIAPYVIRTFPNGHKVGIIGANIRDKTLTGSSPDVGTTLSDEMESVRQQVQILEQKGINKIVLVSHLGIFRDENWFTQIAGVDVIVGGHSHTLMAKNAGTLLTPHSSYPRVVTQASSGNTLCIVHGWKDAHGLGRLRVEFDDDGKVTMCNGDFMIPFEPSLDTTPTEAAMVSDYLTSLGPTFVQVTQEEYSLAIVRSYLDAMVDQPAQVIATDTEALCNERIPGQGGSVVCARTGVFSNTHGGAACNLVAQALLNQTASAEVAIQNAGGCRSDIEAGNFTYGNAMEFLPFSDTLVTLKLKGHQIHKVLEQALELTLEGESAGSYPYASGLRFDVNATSTLGTRISHLQINARLQEGTWNDIDWNRTYTVVTNTFLAAGRDGYLEFRNAEERNDTNSTYLDAFISYVKAQGNISAPNPEDMSTQHFVGLPVQTSSDVGGELPWVLLNGQDSTDELYRPIGNQQQEGTNEPYEIISLGPKSSARRPSFATHEATTMMVIVAAVKMLVGQTP